MLRDIISKLIKEKGAISFKDFMALSLYHKDFGYYSQENLSIGKNGDFVTAPHTSKLFGYLLAVQIEECFNFIDDKIFHLCEFGAGTGVFARDVLEYFSKYSPQLFEKLIYIIIEPLEKRRKALSHDLLNFDNKIKLLSDFNSLEKFQGVIFANELLDAFPVHVIEKQDGEFFEIFVSEKNGHFIEEKRKIIGGELKDYIYKYLSDIPDNYRTEVNLDVKKWINKISENFVKGFIIFIDYGFSAKEYYAPFRNRGTLLGYSNQQTTEDFFMYPGLIDMTAHVNFSDVKRYFEEMGFFIEGYCPQWAFLGSLDFEKTIKRLFGKIDPFSPELAQIKSLIFPQGMGESHKVFVASKSIDNKNPLKGFSMTNHKDRL